MRSVLHRRPSASMIVSLVALVVAMSGTAVAAGRLVIGDHLIRKGSLSGNRLRKHTITGRQINFRKLGMVPKARTAISAVSAGSASLAGHANTSVYAVKSQEAVNADALGGQSPSSFLTTGDRIGTNGIVHLAGTQSGTTVTLFSHGPFTVSLRCQTIGSDTEASLYATSTEADADLGYVSQGHDAPADAAVDLGDVGPGPVAAADNPFPLALEAPSGAQLVANGAVGINDVSGAGTCWANFAGIA